MKAVIINGGNSVASRLTGVQQEIIQLLKSVNVAVDVITVHQLPAEDLITANFGSEAIKEQLAKVEKANLAFVLTPVFKGAYSGILKTFLDLIPQKGLQNKTVFPVAIGGTIAHLLSLEYALKPVVSILGATSIASSVYIVDKQVEKGENGGFIVDIDVRERLVKVIKETQSFNASAIV